jgi:AcrR family transcriptional regulator
LFPHTLSPTPYSKKSDALYLFLKRNPYRFSKEVGVATGTLFNYFPTKEYLINSLYFEVKGMLSRSMGKGIETGSTFQDKLRKLWSNLINWGVDNQEEFLFVVLLMRE